MFSWDFAFSSIYLNYILSDTSDALVFSFFFTSREKLQIKQSFAREFSWVEASRSCRNFNYLFMYEKNIKTSLGKENKSRKKFYVVKKQRNIETLVIPSCCFSPHFNSYSVRKKTFKFAANFFLLRKLFLKFIKSWAL